MKRISVLLMILTLSFTGIYADNKEDSKNLYNNAVSLNKQGKNDEAIQELRKSLELDNTNFWSKKLLVEILTAKGEELYNQGLQKTAFSYFKEAIKLWPNNQATAYWYNKLRPMEAQLQDKSNEIKKEEVKTENTQLENKETQNTVIETKIEPKKEEIKKEELKKEEIRVKETQIMDFQKQLELQKRELMLEFQKKELQNKELLELERKKRELENKEMLLEIQKKELAEKKQNMTSSSIEKQDTGFSLLYLAGILIAVLVIAAISLFIFHFMKKSKKNKKDLLSTESLSLNILKDLIRVGKIKEIIQAVDSGDLDWALVQKLIGELDKGLRSEILSVVENKIQKEKSPVSAFQAEILACFLLDGDDYLRKRASGFLLKAFSGSAASDREPYRVSNAIVSNIEPRLALSSSKTNLKSSNPALVSSSEIFDLRVILALSKIVDRKTFKRNHLQQVGFGTYKLALAVGVPMEEAELYYMAGLVYDIGYLDVSSEILQKPRKLSKEECVSIQTHPQKGLEILDFTEIPQIIKDGILYHHERWDGSGYPENLKENEIPLVARIIAIMDVFEAMTSPRPQRPPLSELQALQMIQEKIGVLFDPALVDAFINLVNQNGLSMEG